MNLSEYHTKELIAQYGVPIPAGRIAATSVEAEARCREITTTRYVVKAQISAGGRGHAGGIVFAATPSAVRSAAEKLIGSNLVTEQTGPGGETVAEVYVEAAVDTTTDTFVAIVLDPETAMPNLLASTKGGVDFESQARLDPGLVGSHAIGDGSGVAAFLDGLGFPDATAAAVIIAKATKAFRANEMLLLEMNPFALGPNGWVAIDAKAALDGNAAFRHPELAGLTSGGALHAAERTAQENEINLVKLDGNIGVVVNGAGLGLATNDMIIAAGGKPANFMDIRTTATSFHIARGVELLLEDPAVDIILLNVHGGGMTVCDTVAEGVAFAYNRAKRRLPIVARLAGANADWAGRILTERRLPVESFPSMTQAIARAAELAGKGRTK